MIGMACFSAQLLPNFLLKFLTVSIADCLIGSGGACLPNGEDLIAHSPHNQFDNFFIIDKTGTELSLKHKQGLETLDSILPVFVVAKIEENWHHSLDQSGSWDDLGMY